MKNTSPPATSTGQPNASSRRSASSNGRRYTSSQVRCRENRRSRVPGRIVRRGRGFDRVGHDPHQVGDEIVLREDEEVTGGRVPEAFRVFLGAVQFERVAAAPGSARAYGRILATVGERIFVERDALDPQDSCECQHDDMTRKRAPVGDYAPAGGKYGTRGKGMGRAPPVAANLPGGILPGREPERPSQSRLSGEAGRRSRPGCPTRFRR